MATVIKKEQEAKLWFAVEVDSKDIGYVQWCGFDEWEAMDASERAEYIDMHIDEWFGGNNMTRLYIIGGDWRYEATAFVHIGAHEMLDKFVDTIDELTGGQITQEQLENEEAESETDSVSGGIGNKEAEQMALQEQAAASKQGTDYAIAAESEAQTS